MRKYTLAQAIQIIAKIHEVPAHSITMCQFEDGSGYKFNFAYFNRKGAHSHFIDMSKYNFPAIPWQQTLYNIYAGTSIMALLIAFFMAFMQPKEFPMAIVIATIFNFVPLYLIGTLNKLIK